MDDKQIQQQLEAARQQQAQLQAALANAQRTGVSNLAKAFVAAWGEIPAVVEKDANNPHFGNDYATLEAVRKLVKPILAKHELAFIQSPGAIDGDKIEILGVLIHSSGERIELRMQMPLGGKLTAQTAGSATTYACRYQLMAVFGIAPTDDDGEAASAPTPKSEKAAPKKTAKKTDAEEETTEISADAEKEKQNLLANINAFTGTPDALSEKLKARVEALGDAEVNKAYVAKRRALKG